MSRASWSARWLRRWHKRLGLVAAAFFAFLALSGLLLNHGDAFGLDATEVGTPWLMAWYGLKPAVPEQGFPLEGDYFCAQGDVWALAGRRIKAGQGDPLGAVRAGGQLWVATADAILLYDAEGRLVDKIERDLLPAVPIRRIGAGGGRLVANAGGALFVTADGVAWERLGADTAVAWSRLGPLPAAQQRQLAPLFAPTLPLQRIVADIHSGRIFGSYGVMVTDALAGILALLAGSGCWLYYRGRARKGDHPRVPGPGSGTAA